MNNLKHFIVVLIVGLLICIPLLNSSIAQAPTKSAENIKTEIILRSMTARESQNFDKSLKEEKQKKSSGQMVVDTLNSAAANASYGSADAMIDVAKENKTYLLKTVQKLIKKIVKNSAKVKPLVGKGGSYLKGTLKNLSGLDTSATGGSFFGSVAGGDAVGAGESLLNSAGSGYAAAGGAKAGAALGSMIAPGPGTVIGGFLGAGIGALAYNEVVAPEVKKAGDYASDKISSGQAKVDNERATIQREYNNNFDTVYPHGYMGSDRKDAVTGMRYDLRPDVLGRAAEKIRNADAQKLGYKIDKEIKELTKKDRWSFAPNKTNSEKNSDKSRITVPNVEEKSLKTAFNILKNAGLIVAPPVGGDPAPSKNLVGHIQEQVPSGGQVQSRDKPIILTVYSDIETPDVVGMTAENALKKLKKAGFTMTPLGSDPPPREELSFLAKEQKPAAYTPGKGYDDVEVTFYPEYQKPTVPAITTLKVSEAQGILEEVGLRLSPDLAWGEQALTREQVGTIQKQLPAAGEPIKTGGEVKAWMYYTAVPKVLTLSQKDAEAAMKAAWFVPNSTKGEAVKNKYKWGTIYSQTLPPKKKIAETNIQVELRFYIKPENKKKLTHSLVGSWQGKMAREKKPSIKLYMTIQSVDQNGIIKGLCNFDDERGKYKAHGTVQGNKIIINSLWYGGEHRFEGILNTQQMTIKGKWSSTCKICPGKSRWKNKGPFSIKKR